MIRSVLLPRLLILALLFTLGVPAHAQFPNIPGLPSIPKIDPGDILNKVLNRNKPQVNANNTNTSRGQVPAPPNDNFADREKLVGTDIKVQADNRGATIEAGEPAHLVGQLDTHTVWWTWTAPATGRLTVDTLGSVSSAFHTDLVVYVGDTLDSLIPVMRSEGATDTYRLVMPVAGGRTYQIASNAPSNAPSYYIGQMGFNLHFKPTDLPPPVLGRDNFADRALLTGGEAVAVADNLQATTEYDEPVHTPGQLDTHTVWWTWTAPATGRLTVDTLGSVSSAFHTDLVVYVGDTLDGLIPVMRSEGATDTYRLVMPVAGGRTYQIASNAPSSNISAYIGQMGFNLRFKPTTLPPPVLGRDNFADRGVLKGSTAMAVANNEQATIEPDEPVHEPGQQDTHTVWWTWTAPSTGNVTLDTLAGVCATNGLALVVYRGTALDDLTPVAHLTGGTTDYALTFPVKSGLSYQIVSNVPSGNPSIYTGQIGFNLHFHPLLPKP